MTGVFNVTDRTLEVLALKAYTGGDLQQPYEPVFGLGDSVKQSQTEAAAR